MNLDGKANVQIEDSDESDDYEYNSNFTQWNKNKKTIILTYKNTKDSIHTSRKKSL
jgi:hypothetical protein